MAIANYSRGTLMFQKFQDYWKFINNFGIAENTDQYWAALIEAAEQLVAKYSQNEKDLFLRDLIMAFIDEKERELQKLKICS